MLESNQTKREGHDLRSRVAGPSRVGEPSANLVPQGEADAPDHFREPGNVTACTVRDSPKDTLVHFRWYIVFIPDHGHNHKYHYSYYISIR